MQQMLMRFGLVHANINKAEMHSHLLHVTVFIYPCLLCEALLFFAGVMWQTFLLFLTVFFLFFFDLSAKN